MVLLIMMSTEKNEATGNTSFLAKAEFNIGARMANERYLRMWSYKVLVWSPVVRPSCILNSESKHYEIWYMNKRVS